MGKHIFSERLSALMDSRGVTQQQLAAATGVNQASVSGWLAGSIPRGDALLRIAEYFGVTMESLVASGTAQRMGSMTQTMREEPAEYGSWKMRAIAAERKLDEIKRALAALAAKF